MSGTSLDDCAIRERVFFEYTEVSPETACVCVCVLVRVGADVVYAVCACVKGTNGHKKNGDERETVEVERKEGRDVGSK